LNQRVRWLIRATCVGVLLLIPQLAWASQHTADPAVRVSDASPFAGSCGLAGQLGKNVRNSEVEPFVDVNPADTTNIIGAWQQDRWSNGASRGNVVGASLDGGQTWKVVEQTKNSLCTGGTLANGGGYERATDPWVTISPNGDAYLMSLSVDQDRNALADSNPDAMLVSKSTDGGLTWSNPSTLIRDANPKRFNDKNSITADPNDSRYVYAVWARLGARGFLASTLFTRTKNGGRSWENARSIFDPPPTTVPVGNQIVVLPDNERFDGELVDVFGLVRGLGLLPRGRGVYVALIRSEDHGRSWSQKPIVVSGLRTIGVTDPDDDGDLVRSADVLPDIAVDPNSGQLYIVWQDARFGGGKYDSIALSTSADGGLTWSQPIKVNRTPTNIRPGNQQAFTPSVDVATDGTVSVSYYDFRNNTSNPNTLLTGYWAVRCHPSPPGDCSNTRDYGNEIALTNGSFDLERAPVSARRGFFLGDYEGLANAGSDFVTFFSRSEGADPASVFFKRFGPKEPHRRP
jgi:hypothetical protein